MSSFNSNQFDFKAWSEERLTQVEQVLKQGIDANAPASLGQAMRYAVLDGVLVHEGDWVLGDSDGVVVIPAADAPLVLKDSIEREAKERLIIERIRQGERTLDVYNFGSKEVRK